MIFQGACVIFNFVIKDKIYGSYNSLLVREMEVQRELLPEVGGCEKHSKQGGKSLIYYNSQPWVGKTFCFQETPDILLVMFSSIYK